MKRIAAMFPLTLAALLPFNAKAQTPIAPPTTGLIVSYQYWPEQLVQYVGTELPYSMITLELNRDGKTPVYSVALTERATERRIQYSNSEAVVAAAIVQGNEAHKTEIAFDAADTTNAGSISTLRMSLADGRPLQWRFVQGSDVSEQGSGLTALPLVPVPVFAYREQGAVAGEGTALQIGDVVSVAEVWKEISRPPYFVAYHGAYTQNAHRLIFGTGNESWTVASAPTSLVAGSAWEMDGDHGRHRTLKIEKVDGGHYSIAVTDRSQPAVRFTLDATREGDAWSILSARYSPIKDAEKHSITVRFATPIGPMTSTAAVNVVAGKKNVIANGTLLLTGDASDRIASLEMKTPAWTQGKVLQEETKLPAGAVTVESQLKP